jgi:hypothetical protein
MVFIMISKFATVHSIVECHETAKVWFGYILVLTAI